MKRLLYIFIGLIFVNVCLNKQAHACSVFTGNYLGNNHIGIETGAITNEKVKEANDIFFMAMGIVGVYRYLNESSYNIDKIKSEGVIAASPTE
jgi:hypothetical protein